MSGPDDKLIWVVQDSKVSEYLLNSDHRKGASKAKYLLAFGFDRDDPETLAHALVKHAIENLPGQLVEPPKGASRRVFEGYVEAPDGRLMKLRTVWEVNGSSELRFITAVPLTRSERIETATVMLRDALGDRLPEFLALFEGVSSWTVNDVLKRLGDQVPKPGEG